MKILSYIAMLCGLLMAQPLLAESVTGEDWREKYDNMSQVEKDEFNRRRAEIKSKVNQMSNEEREAFKKHIESQQGKASDQIIYIEAIPQDEYGDEIHGSEKDAAMSAEDGWKAMSFEEKRKKFFGDSAK